MPISKQKIIIIGAMLAGSFLITACKSTKPTVITEIHTEKVTETLHDTIFEIKADSSYYKALLECQNGKVVTKEILETTPGKIIKVPKVNIVDNQLNVDCLSEAQKLLARWKSQQVEKNTVIPKPIYIEYEPTLLEKFFIGFGKLCLLIVTIWFLVWIIKKQIAAYRLKN